MCLYTVIQQNIMVAATPGAERLAAVRQNVSCMRSATQVLVVRQED
jgi:hypothetical protein